MTPRSHATATLFSRCASSVCQAEARAAADRARRYWLGQISYGSERAELAAFWGRGDLTARLAGEAAARAAMELAIVCWLWRRW